MAYFVDTLIQNTGETDVDFNTRVLQYITDQQYYFVAVGGSFPITAQEGNGGTYKGYPPISPSSDMNYWDVTAAQMKRVVTFSYDNTYYYIFLGTVPPFPPAPPLPTSGDIAMFGPTGQLTGTGMIADTALLEIDAVGYRFTNAADGINPQDLVTMTQLAAAVAGSVMTVNAVAPTLGNIQLTVSNSGTAGTLQWSGLDLQIPTADTDTTGLLSDTDWDTFNNKQPAGNYIVGLTGDGTATGPGTVAFTLATVNADVGVWGSATQTPVFTVNAKGLITAVSNTTITPAASSITGGAALTRVDDTNVTLTLGGSPTTSLLAATSLTLGWTGQLAVSRGGTGVDSAAANRVFASPDGAAGAPSFRALVANDIPSLSSIYQPLDADLTSWAAVTRAAGFDTFAATPSSANLAALLTDETGSGSLVFGTTPTLNQPNIVGTTTNDSAAAGSVGETITQSRVLSAATAMTTATTLNVTATALTLTAGDWDVDAMVGVVSGAGTIVRTLVAGISLTSATVPASDTTGVPTSGEIRIRKVYGTTVGTTFSTESMTEVIGRYRISLNAPTTFYLVAQSTFTVSTLSVFGSVTARRVR